MNTSTLSVDLVRILMMIACQYKFASPALMREMENLLAENAARVPATAVMPIWRNCMAAADDTAFGLHLAEMADRMPMGGVLLPLMMNCATLGIALNKLVAYHHLVTDIAQPQLIDEGSQEMLVWRYNGDNNVMDTQFAEAVTCGLFFTCKRLSAQRVFLEAVRFCHPQPQKTDEHQRIFDCHCFFNQPVNALVFNHQALSLPLPTADPDLLIILEGFASACSKAVYPEHIWTARTAKEISVCLQEAEKPALPVIAARFLVSDRTLQHFLAAEGTTFREVLDGVRRRIALELLGKKCYGLVDIAFLLGFADQSAFNHAFKRWTGSPPGTLKKT